MKWALQVPQLSPWGGCPGHSTGRGTQAELDGPTEMRRQSQESGEAKEVSPQGRAAEKRGLPRSAEAPCVFGAVHPRRVRKPLMLESTSEKEKAE